MRTVSLFEAKTHLSRLVEALVSGREDEVIVSRHGRPVARIAALQPVEAAKRIGIARGRYRIPEDSARAERAVAGLFGIGGRAGRCRSRARRLSGSSWRRGIPNCP